MLHSNALAANHPSSQKKVLLNSSLSNGEIPLKEYHESKLKSGDMLTLEYIKALMKDEKSDTGDLS